MRIVWTKPAIRNLEDIREFLRERSGNYGRVTDRVFGGIEKLTAFPYLGRPGRVRGTRELVIVGQPYVVVYGVIQDAKGEALEIAIYHVYHTSQNWQVYLEQEQEE